VVGNLPYNISKPVLEKLLRSRGIVERAVLMFQAEVADRLLASPGGKAYGALTLMVRYRASPGLILDVSKESFRPRPKVDSKAISLDFSSPFCGNMDNEAWFDTVVRAAFSHRRKTLINSLMGSGYKWAKETLADVLSDCGIDASRRAETLSMDEFLRLSARMDTAFPR
jgi:16S rRNA (adenine1518-N6/adenine1519-N6)-dimethyltransferase